MAHEIVLPSLSAGMEDAVIARWLRREGDTVAKGDVLAEVETDKATMELEAEADGRVGRLFVADGERALVGQVIAVVVAEGEAVPEAAGGGQAAAASQPQPAPEAVPAVAVPAAAAVTTPAAGDGGAVRHRASPLARRIAAQNGVDLDGITGSGPHGRIVRVDVERAIAAAALQPQPAVAAPAPAAPSAPAAIPAGIGAYEAVPHSNVRKVIARRLLEAKTTIPHFYLEADCEIDALLALRAEVNAIRDPADKISVNDFIVKAAALALRKVPDANVIWTGDAILKLADVDIAVAVATDGGLITPIVRQADRKSLGALSGEIRELAARAREGRLRPDEFQGGGFSVSNLGMYGVRSFSAIINPPQSCILAVGAGERRPVVRGDAVVPASVMSCTLSVDHRSVDGALGAQFLAAFRAAVETPMTLLL